MACVLQINCNAEFMQLRGANSDLRDGEFCGYDFLDSWKICSLKVCAINFTGFQFFQGYVEEIENVA